MGWYDRKGRRVRDLSRGATRIFLELEVRRVECHGCGKVKREQLDFLADNPLYTKRFALRKKAFVYLFEIHTRR
jgi:transposase